MMYVSVCDAFCVKMKCPCTHLLFLFPFTLQHERKRLKEMLENSTWTHLLALTKEKRFLLLSLPIDITFSFFFFCITFKPSNMVQRAHANATLNSSMTILKKMPANLTTMPNSQLSPRFYKRSHPSLLSTNRDLSPVRLPSLLKRTTSTGKAAAKLWRGVWQPVHAM